MQTASNGDVLVPGIGWMRAYMAPAECPRCGNGFSPSRPEEHRDC